MIIANNVTSRSRISINIISAHPNFGTARKRSMNNTQQAATSTQQGPTSTHKNPKALSGPSAQPHSPIVQNTCDAHSQSRNHPNIARLAALDASSPSIGTPDKSPEAKPAREFTQPGPNHTQSQHAFAEIMFKHTHPHNPHNPGPPLAAHKNRRAQRGAP